MNNYRPNNIGPTINTFAGMIFNQLEVNYYDQNIAQNIDIQKYVEAFNLKTKSSWKFVFIGFEVWL